MWTMNMKCLTFNLKELPLLNDVPLENISVSQEHSLNLINRKKRSSEGNF